LRPKHFETALKNAGNVGRLACTLNLEEGPPMTIVWIVSLVCWSAAAVLVAGLTFPDIFQAPLRGHGTPRAS